jgi:hypothetical protein
VGNHEGGDHLGDAGDDGRIILKWIFWRLDGEGKDWINLAHDRDRLPALVNTMMDRWVP